MKKIFSRIFLLPKRFIARFKLLHSRLSVNEKRIVFLLFFIILILGGLRINIYIQKNTRLVPTFGGTYQSVMVGKYSHGDPVEARSFIDETVSGLVYSGLTAINDGGQIVPMLALKWSIPEDGKKYIFYLKKDLFWHDEVPVTARDVEFTIQNIQDPANQSPHFDNWQGVTTKVLDDYTIEFSLAEKSSPFLSATTVGIIPSHIPMKDQSRRMVGTGPYILKKAIVTPENGIQQIVFEANKKWIKGSPWIANVNLIFTETMEEAENLAQSNNEVSAISGRFYRAPKAPASFINYQIPTNRKLVLFINAGIDPFKDIENRKKILDSQLVDLGRKVSFLTDKKSNKDPKVENLIKQLEGQKINLDVQDLESGELKDKIDKREYDLLVVPIEFGADQDLYPFFHSSQKNAGGLNFANFEDHDLDSLLADGRMNLDEAKRTDLQKQIDQKLKDLALYKEIDQEKLFWSVSPTIKGIKSNNQEINSVDSLTKIETWYIKQKKTLKYR